MESVRRSGVGTPAWSSRARLPARPRAKQAQAQRHVSGLADVMQAHGRLAVGLLAECPAVLALDAHRVAASLGEGRVIEHEDPGRIGEGAGHQGAVALAHRPLLPGARADKLLQTLVRIFGARENTGQSDAAAQGLDALALAVLEQPRQVHPAPGAAGGDGGSRAQSGRRTLAGARVRRPPARG